MHSLGNAMNVFLCSFVVITAIKKWYIIFLLAIDQYLEMAKW